MNIKSIIKQSQYIKLGAAAVFFFMIAFTLYKARTDTSNFDPGQVSVQFKTYGGHEADTGWDIISVKDGYVVCGDTRSAGSGGSDVYLIKTDKNGALQWSRTFGGTGDETGVSLIEAYGGGYLIAGGTDSEGYGETDGYIVKTDKDGEAEWTVTLGGYNHDYLYSVIKTTDGNYAACGYSSSFSELNSDLYIVKFDRKGNVIWEKVFGSFGWDTGYSIINRKNGSLMAAGYTQPHLNEKTDVYIVTVDNKGNCISTISWGEKREDRAVSVINNGKGYIVAGQSTSFKSRGFGWDVFTAGSEGTGNPGLIGVFPASEMDIGKSIMKTNTGLAVLATRKCYGVCDSNVLLYEADTSGNTLMYKIYAGFNEDRAHSFIKDGDNYVITGFTMSNGNGKGDVFILKTDLNGEIIW